jgi:hypothetical protein
MLTNSWMALLDLQGMAVADLNKLRTLAVKKTGMVRPDLGCNS